MGSIKKLLDLHSAVDELTVCKQVGIQIEETETAPHTEPFLFQPATHP